MNHRLLYNQRSRPLVVRRENAGYNMNHRLLYNQKSRPLVVRRENAALTHEAYTSIQPEESFTGGQERECSFAAVSTAVQSLSQ